MTDETKSSGKSIVRSSFYGLTTWLLPVILSFVATPVIVRSLGHEDYGIYALVLGFIAYSFNFNVGRAITKYVAEYRGTEKNEQIGEIVAATLFINLVVGAFSLVVILAGARYLAVDLLGIQAEAQDKTVHALYAAALTIFFLMLNQVFNSILQGLHRFDLYAKIFNLNNVLLVSGNLLLAIYGFGLLALLYWNMAITALTAFISAMAAKNHLPSLRDSIKFRRATLKLVFRYSSGVIAYQILANVLLLFERGWITAKLGAESLTFYVVPMMLALYIHGFLSSLTMMVFPLASELQHEKEKLLRLYLKATKIVSFLAVFLGMTLIVEGKTFLTLWMDAEFAEKSAGILIFHAVTFSLLGILVVSWQLTDGLGRPRLNTLFFMICFIVCISGMIALLPVYGSYGVAASRTAAFSVLFCFVFIVEKIFFGEIQARFWLKLAGILLLAAALAAAVEKLLIANLGVGWIVFIVATAAGGAVYALTAWLTGFVTDEEIELFRRIYRR